MKKFKLFYNNMHLKNLSFFISFIKANIFNTCFGISLLFFLTLTNLSTWEIILILNICGIIFNYFSYSVAFKMSYKKYILRFIGAYIFLFIFQASIFSIFFQIYGDKTTSAFLCLPFIFFSNYFVLARFVFNNRQ